MTANDKTAHVVEPSQSYKKDGLILAVILAIAAGLRANGLFWDAPYYFNPDEKRLINWGMTFNYFDPGVSEWGTLPLLLIRAITALLGLFSVPERAEIYVIARVLSVLLGCATIYLVYRLARKVYSQQTARWSALFTAITVLHIQYSHFYSLDNIFTFFIIIALFPIITVAQEEHRRQYLLAGLSIGLATAVRLNGVFLFGPFLIAHLFGAYRCQFGEEQNNDRPPFLQAMVNTVWLATTDSKLWLALGISGLTFVVLTPTAVFDPYKYLFHDGLVWVLLQSSGYLKSQYTLQFEGTGPWFYISNLLFWGVGPFLLVAYGAGMIYSLVRWRAPAANLIILSFVALYFSATIDSRVKFIRYGLPALPLLNLLTAEFFTALRRTTSKNRLLSWSATLMLVIITTGTALYALAFANIYSQPDTRIVAAHWIQENIPPGSSIVHESDVTYAPPLGFYDKDQNRYRFAEINLNELYESSSLRQRWHLPPALEALGVSISRRGNAVVPSEPEVAPLSETQKEQYLGTRLRCADYIILSDRHYSVYRDQPQLFPVESEYYARLFSGQLGFRPIKSFQRQPGLLGWRIDDSTSELTFRIFDHPTIWIFQSQLPQAYLNQHPPQRQTENTWANVIKLVGYNLNKTTVAPNGSLELHLYWEALSSLDRDFTIFLQLQNDTHQIVAQNDYQVAGGLLPTSCWQPGRLTVDTTVLSIPPQTPPGTYQLKLGWYDVATLERLPLIADASGEQALGLVDIEIQE